MGARARPCSVAKAVCDVRVRIIRFCFVVVFTVMVVNVVVSCDCVRLGFVPSRHVMFGTIDFKSLKYTHHAWGGW